MCPFKPADRGRAVTPGYRFNATVARGACQCRGFGFGVGRRIRPVRLPRVQAPASIGSAARSARASSSPCAAARSDQVRAWSILVSPAKLRAR